ncbi:MAG TPA: sigma-70 family RNA polymerase sigma factor [Verrucomicrobiales bacterium]|nr:sigma-70 family RNA polymerase sigma factor [Verrucomicrobiales bacterium]
MTEPEDIALLREWVEARSDTAFRALVERYAPLVWGAAMRKTRDRDMAEEAVQQVFADLAGKAPVLVALRRPLAPWLHRSAIFEAVQVLRRELRHRDRMKLYADTDPGAPSPPDARADAGPHLDDAINSLNEKDRRVLLLHWFEKRSFAEVAAQTGCTPAAAQRRGLRALEKLATSLRRRGVVAPGTLLAAGLTAHLTPQVPAAVTCAVCSAASTSSGMSGTATLYQQWIHVMASSKVTFAAVLVLSAALPVTVKLAGSEGSGAKPVLSQAPASSSAVESTTHAAASVPEKPETLDLALVQRALNRLLSYPDDYQTELEVRRLVFSLSMEEIAGVQKILLSMPARGNAALGEACRALFARWAELSPSDASEAAWKMPRADYGYSALRGAFVTWAVADLDAAWAWLEQKTTDPVDREKLGGEALETVIAYARNGEAIMARVDAMPESLWRAQMRSRALHAWATRDAPDTMIRWARKLPANGERNARMAEVVEQIGIRDPSIALGYLRHLEDPALRVEAGLKILTPYVLARDPTTTCSPPDFVQDMKNVTDKYPVELYRETGAGLARHGAKWAMAKMRELPAGAARDEFIQGMLENAVPHEAKNMLPALSVISAEVLTHSENAGRFAQTVFRKDPRASAEWIASLPADSPVLTWANEQFTSVAGRSAAEFLSSSPK